MGSLPLEPLLHAAFQMPTAPGDIQPPVQWGVSSTSPAASWTGATDMRRV